MNKNWKEYIGKKVRLIIEDTRFPQPRDGILIDVDNTHVWLKLENVEVPKPFLKLTVRRVDIRE